MSAITIINSRIEEKKIDDPQIKESLKILSAVSGQINTEIIISGEKKEIGSSHATAEELDGLPNE